MSHEDLINKVEGLIKNGERLASNHESTAQEIIKEIYGVMRNPTRDMQQVVSANWGRRTWADYQKVIDASPLSGKGLYED